MTSGSETVIPLNIYFKIQCFQKVQPTMDIDKQIEDLCNYVDKASSDSTYLAEVDKNRANFDQDLETVVNDLQLKLADIDRRRTGHQQEIKVLTEKMKMLEAQLREAEAYKKEVVACSLEVQAELKKAEEKLLKVEEEFDNFKKEADSASKTAENIPKLSQYKRLMYKISKMTFDTPKANRIRGFVMNTRLDDVYTFDFNKEDKSQSAQFISNYVWDLIANGADDAWSK